MMDIFSLIADVILFRSARVPRSAGWLVWAVLILVGYFVVIEPTLDHAARVRDRADAIDRSLAAQAKLAAEREQAGGATERGLAVMGLPNLPTSADAAEALNRRIDRVARDHAVTIKRRTERPRSPIPGNPEWNTQRLEQVGVEFSIDCDTAQLAAVLRDLETAPEIHGVTQVRVQRISAGNGKTDSGLLSVSLLPVTWVLPKEGAK